ncbi:hypothetical protein GCM10022245_68810 [Streptomyces mayteni]
MAPVLAPASHIPSSEIGTGYFQETHPDQLLRINQYDNPALLREPRVLYAK